MKLGHEFKAPWRSTPALLHGMGRGMPEGVILNVGAGPPQGQGRVNTAFRGRKIVHTDIARFPGLDRLADVEALPFSDGAFSGVVCCAVLEHVTHPWVAFHEMARVLKPGGLLLVICPWMWRQHGADFVDHWRFALSAYGILAEGTGLAYVKGGYYRPAVRRGKKGGPWIDSWAVLVKGGTQVEYDAR